MRGRNRASGSSGLGCAVMLILGLLAMPLIGLFVICKYDDDDSKVIGCIMIVVGIIIWIVALCDMG